LMTMVPRSAPVMAAAGRWAAKPPTSSVASRRHIRRLSVAGPAMTTRASMTFLMVMPFLAHLPLAGAGGS
jgi:hypothetical protein